jgi:hypothetical protein
MTHEHEDSVQAIKSNTPQQGEAIAEHPGPIVFNDKSGMRHVLRHPNWRVKADTDLVHRADIIGNPYHHPSSPELVLNPRVSQTVARREITRMQEGDTSPLSTGVEIEGSLVSKDGKNLVEKYDGIHFTADNDEHPELVSSMVEVATGKLPDGSYPSKATDIAKSLALAVKQGTDIAKIRNAHAVFASVIETGSIDQIRLTQNAYSELWSPEPIRESPWADNIPAEVYAIFDKVGITDLVPIQATHTHTSNPRLPDSDLYDPRIAYAKSKIRLTQFEKTLNFMLYSTNQYLGHNLEGVRDVRALVRRGPGGAQDSTIPATSYDYFEEASQAVAKGEIHSFSRHPWTGQHDKVRLKEFGTTEGIDGAGNPDLRIVLAKIYVDQLKDVLAYQAMEAVGGDETKVLPYLRNKYGPIFTIIPTLKGENSSFQQDLRFNKDRFKAKGHGGSYENQLRTMRKIIHDVARDVPAFQTQALLADHVLSNIVKSPSPTVTLEQYLDYQSGIKPGIVTDYKTGSPAEHSIVQAEATKNQALALLEVHTDTDLFDFFGLSQNQRATQIYPQ